ncbi:MAG: hypothetical protein JKY51_06585 [Opitutaceae bacterium]|nr:hypothetical protein [Opitutaceae bacterium]
MSDRVANFLFRGRTMFMVRVNEVRVKLDKLHGWQRVWLLASVAFWLIGAVVIWQEEIGRSNFDHIGQYGSVRSCILGSFHPGQVDELCHAYMRYENFAATGGVLNKDNWSLGARLLGWAEGERFVTPSKVQLLERLNLLEALIWFPVVLLAILIWAVFCGYLSLGLWKLINWVKIGFNDA